MRGSRVLFYVDRLPSIPALQAALADLGVEVRSATSFRELSALLLCWRDWSALLLQPPATGTHRRAVLESIRRLAPTLPVLAVVPAITAEVEHDLASETMVSIVSAHAAPHQIVGELARALRDGPPTDSADEPSPDGDAQ